MIIIKLEYLKSYNSVKIICNENSSLNYNCLYLIIISWLKQCNCLQKTSETIFSSTVNKITFRDFEQVRWDASTTFITSLH